MRARSGMYSKGDFKMNRFEDRVVIITGGTSGIGQAAAVLFAKEGANVAICGRNEKGAEATLEMIRTTGRKGFFVRCDVSLADDVKRMIDRTVEEYGKINYAINNSGVRSEHARLADSTEENWNSVIDINLKGIWLCMKYEIPELLKNPEGGAIVNTSSALGEIAIPNMSAYIASKHGVHGLTKSAAIEYAKDSYSADGRRIVRINAVAPGYIRTAIQEQSLKDPEIEKKKASMQAMGRIGTPEEVARAILWLCSEDASFITGAILPVDGGALAGRW